MVMSVYNMVAKCGYNNTLPCVRQKLAGNKDNQQSGNHIYGPVYPAVFEDCLARLGRTSVRVTPSPPRRVAAGGN